MSLNQDPTITNDPRFEELSQKLASRSVRHQIFGERVHITSKGIGIPVEEANIYSPDSMSDEQQSNS